MGAPLNAGETLDMDANGTSCCSIMDIRIRAAALLAAGVRYLCRATRIACVQASCRRYACTGRVHQDLGWKAAPRIVRHPFNTQGSIDIVASASRYV